MLALSTAWLVPQAPAWAALGAADTSVASDQAALRGQIRVTSKQLYDVHELTTEANVAVHEYATRGGEVFAVTWQGQSKPDLRQLFGDYFARYQAAAAAAVKQQPGIRREFSLNQTDLVVRSSAHMRSYRGIAYLPALIPSGVTLSELQ